MVCIKYGFELPRKKDGEELEEHRWTKKQQEKFMFVEFHLLSALPMQEINKIDTYHSTKEL